MTAAKDRQYEVGVLFVCMGNICRSPTAEGVFRKLVTDAALHDKVFADSAGTHAYHQGEPPDRRAAEAAMRRGYSLDGIRARRVTETDFENFHYVLAMDEDNYGKLREAAGDLHIEKVRLFLSFATNQATREVPDPYYGGAGGFERVLDLVEEASQGLLDEIRRKLTK